MPPKPKQPVTNLKELLAQLKRQQESFKSMVERHAAAVHGDALVGNLMKTTKSAIRKILTETTKGANNQEVPLYPNELHTFQSQVFASESDYDSFLLRMNAVDASGMFDILRATITVGTPTELRALSNAVANDSGWSPARCKSRYFGTLEGGGTAAQKSGYRDIQYVLKNNQGFLAELQLNTRAQAELKEMEHCIYEISRAQGRALSADEKTLILKSYDSYGKDAYASKMERDPSKARELDTIISTIRTTRDYEVSAALVTQLFAIAQELYQPNDSKFAESMITATNTTTGKSEFTWEDLVGFWDLDKHHRGMELFNHQLELRKKNGRR